jgi:hypothetical protein
MYGMGDGASMLEEDFMPLSYVLDEARVVVQRILSLLGGPSIRS